MKVYFAFLQSLKTTHFKKYIFRRLILANDSVADTNRWTDKQVERQKEIIESIMTQNVPNNNKSKI